MMMMRKQLFEMQIMTSGILIKTAAAICAAFPVCVIGGLAYSVAANVPFLKAMKVAYNVASDSPGPHHPSDATFAHRSGYAIRCRVVDFWTN